MGIDGGPHVIAQPCGLSTLADLRKRDLEAFRRAGL